MPCVYKSSTLADLGSPGRFLVSPKLDGERAILVAQRGSVWLVGRNVHERRRFRFDDHSDAGMDVFYDSCMLLDGEWFSERDVFVAFDVLYADGRAWLADAREARLQRLNAFGFERVGIDGGIACSDARVAVCVKALDGRARVSIAPCRQTKIFVKDMAVLTATNLSKALCAVDVDAGQQSSHKLPCDGLVFSESKLAYGAPRASIKWQAR